MQRTVLEIIQDFALKVGMTKPTRVYGSTEREAQEIGSFVSEVAERIAEAHNWSALTVEAENAGDGVATGFDLPSDYQRMPKDGQVWSTRWQRPLVALSGDDWLRLSVREYDLVSGSWIIRGGKMLFRPNLVSGESARWNYISKNAVRSSGGAELPRFENDSDTFVLGDRVLETQLIWEWRQSKGLPYAEDMATAEIVLARAIDRDGGAKILTQSSRSNVRANVAYPWQITP